MSHFPNHKRDAFARWVEQGMPAEVEVEVKDYDKPVKLTHIEFLRDFLDCTDIIPKELRYELIDVADLDEEPMTYYEAAHDLLLQFNPTVLAEAVDRLYTNEGTRLDPKEPDPAAVVTMIAEVARRRPAGAPGSIDRDMNNRWLDQGVFLLARVWEVHGWEALEAALADLDPAAVRLIAAEAIRHGRQFDPGAELGPPERGPPPF